MIDMVPRFRAWHIKGKKMYDVQIIDYTKQRAMVISRMGIVFPIKFDDMILMQSTGLHDRNHKEIFEGDIVMTFDAMLSVKKDENGNFILEPNVFDWSWSRFACDKLHGTEIIDNIHAHPGIVDNPKDWEEGADD